MKLKQIIKLTLVVCVCGFLTAHKANAKELLTPDEIKSLHLVSKNVLVSRVIEKKRVESEKKWISDDIQKMQDALSYLEASMWNELTQVNSVKKSGEDLLDEPLLDLSLSESPDVVLEGRQNSSGGKNMPRQMNSAESKKQSLKGSVKTKDTRKEQAARYKNEKRIRTSKAVDTAISWVSSKRIKLEEEEAKFQKRSNPGKQTGSVYTTFSDNKSVPKNKVGKQRLHKKLLDVATEIENELLVMKQTGADYKKVKELKKRFMLEKKISVEKEVEPTIITINKHRD